VAGASTATGRWRDAIHRVLRGVLAAPFAPVVVVVAGGGPSRYFDRWERTAAVVILAIGGFAFAALVNVGTNLRTEVRSQRYWPLLLFPLEAPLLLAPWIDVRPGKFTALRVDGSIVRVVGLLVLAAGPTLQVWSELTLGRFYIGKIGVLEDHELVRSGPFRVIRHPAYAGELLTDAGTGLVFGVWIGIPVALLVLLLLAHRITEEERVLEEAFGDAYRDMRATTWKVIPLIY
jgi:protein-S-isoprenylcysteine O-methyltransferase Ste14